MSEQYKTGDLYRQQHERDIYEAHAAVVEAAEKLFDAGISRIPTVSPFDMVAVPIHEMDEFRDAVRNLRRLRELEEK